MTELETIRAALQAGLVALELVAEDSARLDWLSDLVIEDQYHFDIAIQSDYDDGVWVSRIWRHDSGRLRGVPLDEDATKTETLRAAIDAAMAATAEPALVPLDQQPEGRP